MSRPTVIHVGLWRTAKKPPDFFLHQTKDLCPPLESMSVGGSGSGGGGGRGGGKKIYCCFLPLPPPTTTSCPEGDWSHSYSSFSPPCSHGHACFRRGAEGSGGGFGGIISQAKKKGRPLATIGIRWLNGVIPPHHIISHAADHRRLHPRNAGCGGVRGEGRKVINHSFISSSSSSSSSVGRTILSSPPLLLLREYNGRRKRILSGEAALKHAGRLLDFVACL